MPISQYGNRTTLEDVFRERPRDVSAIDQLERNKMPGRDRTKGELARSSAPSSSGDVVDNDREYDFYYDSSYVYRVLSISGSLTWVRSAITTSW